MQDEQQPELGRLLLSAKLHSGWISDVHLLPSHGEAPAGCLLTASNDATCMLWDIGRLEGGRPVCLHAATDLHTGAQRLLIAAGVSGTALLHSMSQDAQAGQAHQCVTLCFVLSKLVCSQQPGCCETESGAMDTHGPSSIAWHARD